MTAIVDEQELLQLNVGDFVAVLTHNMGDGKAHWTLGSVETPPYMSDVEVRLWEKQKDEEYDENGDLPSNEETEELMRRIAEVKGELQKSIDETDALTEQLRARRASIMREIGEADEYVAESKAVMHAARDDVESIPDRHWNELKSYRVPPKMVSLVIRAIMLLLSEDEARTWPQMQRVLRDFNFKSRITSYDPEQQLSPERREYILQECVSKKSFRYDRAMQGSVAIGPIYYWVLAQLDCGEAQSNKTRVDKEKVARQKELRRVLKQLNAQQARIAEYQALMDDLDDQLKRCRERTEDASLARSSGGGHGASTTRSRLRNQANARYESSFAGEQQKEYLRSAFYSWRPTERVIIVLRSNVICNFGPTTTQEREEGYNMSEPQVRLLDDVLLRRQAEYDAEDEDARRRREEEEERRLESDMLAQNVNEQQADTRDDEDILKDRERAAAEGKPTPVPSPRNDDPAGIRGIEATERLQKKFEGKSWQKILERKREAIASTFVEESAEALDVPDYYVSVVDLTVGSLIVDFDASHDGQRTTEQLQSAVDDYDYPKMKALYEEEEEAIAAEEELEAAAAAPPLHQMRFGGDRWGDILPDNRDSILDAFLADTCEATSAARADIEVADIRVEGEDGLAVDYLVNNNDLTPAEVQVRVDEHDYPCVWALYQQLTDLEEAGQLHQVRFRGERWESLLEESRPEITEAFATDAGSALEVQPEQIHTEDIRYERGLSVPYTVAQPPVSEDEIDAKVDQYPFPQTWALYDRLVAEACGAHYQKAFHGAYWEAVLSEQRPALTDAFRNDSATALDVPVQKIEACSLDTDEARLLVSFNVADADVTEEAVRSDTKAFEYPATWALYGQTVKEQQDAVTNMEQPFAGLSWGAMVINKEAAITESFCEDVATYLEIPADAVAVHSIATDEHGMTVKFGVSHEGILEYDVKKGLEDRDFPLTWEHYEELTEAELAALRFGAGAGESGILERRFEGDDWDILVDGAPDELREAFIKDTAKCVGTSQSNVRVLSCEVGSLVVTYQIIDPQHDDAELMRLSEEHDYEELNSLYKRRIRGGGMEEGEAGKARGLGEEGDAEEDDGVPGTFRKRFEGENWQDVVAEHQDDVEEAFRGDEAKCLDLTPEQVEVRGVKADEGGVTIGYDLHDAVGDDSEQQQQQEAGGAGAPAASTYTREEVEQKTDSYDYPAVWSLYDESEFITTTHQVGFDGDDWGRVVEDKREALEEAFTTCTAELFGLRARNVVDARYTVGSLIVDFGLQHPATLSEEEINQKVHACPYDPVWELYGSRPQALATSVHEVGFEGEGWNGVIDSKREAIEAALVEDTGKALEIEPSAVKVTEIVYVEESLIARLEVEHNAADDNEVVQQQLKDYPYRTLWALYEENPEDLFVTTAHQVGFDGDDWKYVVENKREELHKAFVEAVSETLDVREDFITNVQYATENDAALLVDLEIKHPTTLTEDEANDMLGKCPFTGVWALYGDHPYDPEEVTTTTHEIGFEGDEWASIEKTQREQLIEAIIVDTAEALSVERDDVKDVETSVNSDVLIAKLHVSHHIFQDEEVIQEQLSAYPYERVWALYEEAPISEAEDGAAAGLGAGQGESGELERVFEGDDWDILLDECPDDVRGAFQRDAANRLGVAPDRVRVLSTEIGSLIVRYQVIDPEHDDDELARHIQEHDFPELSGMYRRRLRGGDGEDDGAAAVARGVVTPRDDEAAEYQGAYSKSFEGKYWKDCVDDNREPIEEAFVRDTATAMDVAPERVSVKSVKADEEGVRVGYDIADEEVKEGEEAGEAAAAPVTAEAVAERTDSYDYPAVWALYGELSEYITTPHALRFEAEGWDYIVRRRRWELSRAIADDAAEELGIEPDALVDTEMVCTAEDLNVTASLTHKRELTAEEIDRKLDGCPFRRVWELYKLLSPSEVLPRRFDGDGWTKVATEHPNELRKAFANDTAKSLNVSRLEVEVEDVAADEEGVTIQYVVRGSSLEEEQLKQRTEDYAYPETWGLYEGSIASHKHFDGEAWGDVVRDRREDLVDAFSRDTAEATGVPADAVEVRQVRANEDGLDVDYLVDADKAESVPPRPELERMVNDGEYPATWELHQQAEADKAAGRGLLGAGDRESGELERVFEGDDWDILIDGDCRGEIDDAFQTGASSALGVSKSDVVVLDAKIGSLHVNYKIRGCEDDDEEISRKIQEHDFPELMGLYKARIRAAGMGDEGEAGKKKAPLPEGYAETGHQVGFDGEDWAYVVKTKEPELQEAIKTDVAKALEVTPEDVDDIATTIDNQMLVDFNARHPEELTEADVDERLKSCRFESVWMLYGGHPYDPKTMVTTNHDIGFEGEDWEYVMKKKPEEVRNAFKTGTANALTLPESDILDVEVAPTEEGIFISCNVNHSPLQAAEVMQEQLKTYPYEEMWALYETRPYDPNEKVETTHEVRFEGEGWQRVCELEGEEVRRALHEDSAVALSIEQEEVVDVEYDAADDALTGRVKVSHSPLMDDDMVQELLASHAFPNLWALYDRSTESEPMTKTFEGAGWPVVLGEDGENTEMVKEAFQADTAAMLNLSPNHILVRKADATAEEGLAVEYSVFGNAISTDEIDSRAADYEYANVWSLYEEKGGKEAAAALLGAGDRESGELERVFEGDDWDILIDGDCRGDIDDAFQTGASSALGISKSDVVVLDAKIGSLHVNYKIRGCEDDDEEISRKIQEHDFPELMGLYKSRIRAAGMGDEGEAAKARELPSDIPTGHEISFEADDWPFVLEHREAEVKEAIKEDVARALGVPAEDVQSVDMTVDDAGLHAAVIVAPAQGETRRTREEIQQALDEDEFPKTWALYVPEDEAPQTAKRIEGEAWAVVVKGDEENVKKAFARDTAAAVGAKPEDVVVESIAADESGMQVSYKVLFSEEEPSDLDAKTAGYAYPETWGLYPEEETTEHDHGFEGEDWEYVWSIKEELVKEAFQADVAAALGIPAENTSDMVMEKSDDGIVITGKIRHLATTTKESIDETLGPYAFPQLWALYETRPFDPTKTIETQHSIRFEGEAWGYVMEHRAKELDAAVRNDAAAALKLDPEAVLEVNMTVDPAALEAIITIKHSPLLDAEMVKEELSAFEYDSVWALYCPPDEAPIGQQFFEGEHWEGIVKAGAATDNAAIKEAFINDTSAALHTGPEDIEWMALETDATGMTIEYAVQFCLRPSEEVEAVAGSYPYPQVWELYKPITPPAKELAPEPHRKSFEGESWDDILSNDRQSVDDAFKRDTAAAIGVEPEQVEVTSIFTTPEEGMTVNYHVSEKKGEGEEADGGAAAAPAPTSEEVEEKTGVYAYPAVWRLYEEATGERESGELERVFDGDDWDILIDGGCRGDIDGAFQADAASALGVPKSNVIVLDAKIGSLHVNYKIRGCADDDDEISRKIQEHDFPELMGLYKARIRAAGMGEEGAAEDAKGSAPVTETALGVHFDGDDWDYVLESKTPAVVAAFKEETALALGITQKDVTVTSFVLGSLRVEFKVRHDGSYGEDDMRGKIDAYPYEKVWALYEDRPTTGAAPRALAADAAPTTTSTHEVGFEAPNWEFIERTRREEIHAAFAAAAGTACGVEPSNIHSTETVVYPTMMKITAQVTHPKCMSAESVNDAMTAYEFAEVWALYEDEAPGRTTGTLTKTFDGDAWSAVVQGQRGALTEAFRVDTSNCLNIPRAAVAVQSLADDRLVVSYTARVPDAVTEAEVQRLTGEYAYPEVWALYKPAGAAARGGLNDIEGDAPSQRLFKGSSWDVVVAKKRAELKTAFAEDTAAATGAAVEHISLVSLYTTEGGLVMNYRIEEADGADRAAHDNAIRDGEYAQVWALYRELADDGFITTSHGVGFDGEDWDYVLERNRQAFVETFTVCTAELLGVQSRHLEDLSVAVEEDNSGVSVTFSLKHARSLTKAAIDEKLQAAEYDPLWRLYETRPYDPTRVVVTSHLVRFDGEHWDTVLATKREQLDRAFAADVADAMQVEVDAVKGIRVEVAEAGIAIGANVDHSPLQDQEMIQEELERHDFAAVWRLYEERPFPVQGGRQTATTHQVGFEGAQWAAVLGHRRTKVIDAIRTDTAAALQLLPEDVLEVAVEEQADIMVANIVVQHPHEQSEEQVQEQLSRFEYERVWALYDDTTAPRVDVLKVRGNGRLSNPLTRRFDGVDWDMALKSSEAQLRDAFALDTAEVLQCQRSQIVVESMTVGSLVVQYRVRDLDITEKAAAALVEDYAYPNIWALYKPTSTLPATSTDGPREASTSRAPPAPVRRSSTRKGSQDVARQEAEDAALAAAEAKEKEQRAAEAARVAQQQLDDADLEARRAEEEAQHALAHARERREAAAAAATAARAEEDRRAAEALAEAERALDAARKAEAVAEDARRRAVPPPLETGESESEEQSVAYLRKALAEARRERDEYQELLEEAEARNRNIASMQKDVDAMRAADEKKGKKSAGDSDFGSEY